MESLLLIVRDSLLIAAKVDVVLCAVLSEISSLTFSVFFTIYFILTCNNKDQLPELSASFLSEFHQHSRHSKSKL